MRVLLDNIRKAKTSAYKSPKSYGHCIECLSQSVLVLFKTYVSVARQYQKRNNERLYIDESLDVCLCAFLKLPIELYKSYASNTRQKKPPEGGYNNSISLINASTDFVSVPQLVQIRIALCVSPTCSQNATAYLDFNLSKSSFGKIGNC